LDWSGTGHQGFTPAPPSCSVDNDYKADSFRYMVHNFRLNFFRKKMFYSLTRADEQFSHGLNWASPEDRIELERNPPIDK